MRKLQFKDFITLQRGFDLPRKDMIEGPYPAVGSTSIIGWHNEYKKNPPGVVTGRSGSLGFVQFIKEKYWPHNTSLWVKDFKGNHPQYVYYFLKTVPFGRFNSGAGVPTLNRNDLDTYEICIHDYNAQRKISAILSAYDDLIENNTRRIQILEEMAQRIYREWFVHFRYPDHENDKLVESELGMNPEGWEITNLGDLFNIKYGKGLPLISILEAGKYPVYGAGDVIGYYNELVVNEKVALITCRGNGSGTVWRTRGPSFVTNNSFFLLPKESYSHLEYHFAEQFLLNSNVKIALSGSAQPQITITGLSTVKTLMPAKFFIERYCENTRDIPELIDKLYEKNRVLRQAHDLLLPKLISGKVDVSELDIDVGETDDSL